MSQNYWRKCNMCKNEIPFSHKYYVCSVSTCNKKRAPMQFCSVSCWDAHNGMENHKSAWAEDMHSPSKSEWERENQVTTNEERPRRRIVTSKPISSHSEDLPEDILVVVSKLKAYIKAKSDMNTSADVMPVLSDIIRKECDRAIEKANMSGRKTVMARDF